MGVSLVYRERNATNVAIYYTLLPGLASVSETISPLQNINTGDGAEMGDTPNKLSILEAVEAGWASRPTLYRAIKRGRLSVEKLGETGRTVLDVAELVRLFGEPKSRDRRDAGKITGGRLVELQAETERLKERLAMLEADRDRLAEAQRDAVEREKWLRGQMDRHTALLASYGPRASLWGRIFGGGKSGQGDKG